jgi:hypothetical protein
MRLSGKGIAARREGMSGRDGAMPEPAKGMACFDNAIFRPRHGMPWAGRQISHEFDPIPGSRLAISLTAKPVVCGHRDIASYKPRHAITAKIYLFAATVTFAVLRCAR